VTLGPTNPRQRRRLGVWLALWAVMVLLTVVIGGVTRLTESGLSITEWNPVSGVLPPLTEAQWRLAFEKYQQIPEYQQINTGMSLTAFKGIFLVEYTHRLWARLVGVVFAVPLLVFLLRGGLGRRLVRRLVALLVMMGLQGGMGWYMVQSGLTERTDVSQYRLAAHLMLALFIFAVAVWTAADLLSQDPSGKKPSPRAQPGPAGFTLLVLGTALAGAFVAGLDAGKAYNTFPLMGGRVFPLGYFQLTPWYRNIFEHVPAVQFNHRLLGIAVVLSSLAVWWINRRKVPGTPGRRLAGWIGVAGLAQAGLGVATLLLVVPIPLAALHQAGAVMLLGLALLWWHASAEAMA